MAMDTATITEEAEEATEETNVVAITIVEIEEVEETDMVVKEQDRHMILTSTAKGMVEDTIQKIVQRWKEKLAKPVKQQLAISTRIRQITSQTLIVPINTVQP